jgi:hypothetical protein
MQNKKKTTHFSSSRRIVFDVLNERKASTTLIISHAFMPRKFIDVEQLE